MEFRGKIAEIQQAMAATGDLAARRRAVLHDLAPHRGERVLEVGCGSGLLLREIALALGPHGLAMGLDRSPDQIAAALAEGEGVPALKAELGDACAIPFGDALFDAAVATHVIEYIEAAETALAEIRRVLKPGARFVCLATNWDNEFWHGPDRALTAEVTEPWKAQAPWPNLPACIGPMLARAGFRGLRQVPVPVVSSTLSESQMGVWMSRLMAAFAVEQGVAEETARRWLDAIGRADEAGEFFYSSLPILTSATAA